LTSSFFLKYQIGPNTKLRLKYLWNCWIL